MLRITRAKFVSKQRVGLPLMSRVNLDLPVRKYETLKHQQILYVCIDENPSLIFNQL